MRDYGDEVSALCLQMRGVEPRRIAAVMRRALPELASAGEPES